MWHQPKGGRMAASLGMPYPKEEHPGYWWKRKDKLPCHDTCRARGGPAWAGIGEMDLAGCWTCEDISPRSCQNEVQRPVPSIPKKRKSKYKYNLPLICLFPRILWSLLITKDFKNKAYFSTDILKNYLQAIYFFLEKKNKEDNVTGWDGSSRLSLTSITHTDYFCQEEQAGSDSHQTRGRQGTQQPATIFIGRKWMNGFGHSNQRKSKLFIVLIKVSYSLKRSLFHSMFRSKWTN